jgi:hypothetical protein
MAESDGKPASSPLSTEEADRLSEQIKPSWEAEPDPPTIPRVEPPTLPAADPPTMPRVEPVAKVEPAPVAKVEPAPVAKVGPTPVGKVEPVPVAKVEPVPVTKVEPMPIAKVEPAPIAKLEQAKPLLKQTLLGISAPIPSPPPADAPNKAPDDLDWELSTNPVPSPIEDAAPAIEPPPKSNPSGLGEKYVPKDTNAPAIVLKEEVKRAEEYARAELAAEHRARSAPTVLKFKAIEVPKKEATDELEELPFGAPKRRLGVWIGLGAGVASIALIGILVAGRGSGREEPTAPPEEIRAAPRATEAEAPPPAPTPTPAPEPEPVVSPSAEPPAVVVAPAKDPEPTPTTEPAKPEPAAKPAPPPKPAPKPVAAAPKPSPKPATQPASKPASPTKASKPVSGGIVRDAPF